MRFIHSSDLQIGKVFSYLEPDVAVLLQDARQAVVGVLGQLAIKHGATSVLLAGDVYDKQQLSQVTLARPVEAMRRFPQLTWHLIPGNHDCLRDNGLWDRLQRLSLPANVKLHTAPGPVSIGASDEMPVFLLPAPLKHISSVDDLTSYMDGAATPDGAIRIGIAHGSITGFGSEGEASNYVSPRRPEEAGLAYLAMGDWHRQMRIGDRVWYSGTPEPDQFKLPPAATGSLCNGGGALLVDIAGPKAIPLVTPLETGRYRWHQLSRTLTDEAQVALLATGLRSLDSDLSKIVLDLRIEGALSLAGRKAFEDQIAGSIRAAVCGLRLNDQNLRLEPTESDLDDIDRSGFVRTAADRLREMSADASDPRRAKLASLALKRLYVEHLREGAR
jgi:DNA repair exonuclease SbcCD nuclease subunit